MRHIFISSLASLDIPTNPFTYIISVIKKLLYDISVLTQSIILSLCSSGMILNCRYRSNSDGFSVRLPIVNILFYIHFSYLSCIPGDTIPANFSIRLVASINLQSCWKFLIFIIFSAKISPIFLSLNNLQKYTNVRDNVSKSNNL